MNLKTQLDRRKKSNTTTIVVVVAGVAIVGLVAVALVGGGGGGAGGVPGGDVGSPTALDRPGYKILPRCAGLEVKDIGKAIAYAESIVASLPPDDWEKQAEVTILGSDCRGLPQNRYLAHIKQHGPFLYSMMAAVLRGAVAAGYTTLPAAETEFAGKRAQFIALGIPAADLIPVKISR